MKTLQINSPLKKNNLFVLTFIISSLFFLASCQKDEQSLPSSENNLYGERQVQNADVKPPLADVKKTIVVDAYTKDKAVISPKVIFEMIKINHLAGKSMYPDYSVTVFSNGRVEYDGRGNVAVKKKVIMQITDRTIGQLRNLFEDSNLFSMAEDLPLLAETPQVWTTYNASLISEKAPKTLLDHNHGYPAELIALRIQTESILNIAPLVTGHDSTTALDIAKQ